MKLLVKNGADIHTADKLRRTTLHCAAEVGEVAISSSLLENGANFNAKDAQERIVLQLALEGRQFTVVKEKQHAAVRLLIERGANLNAKGRYGLTLLHIYAQRGNRIQVQLLLEYGANVNVRDNIGHTPLFLANYHGHEAVAELLREYGAYTKVGSTTYFLEGSNNGHAEEENRLDQRLDHIHNLEIIYKILTTERDGFYAQNQNLDRMFAKSGYSSGGSQVDGYYVREQFAKLRELILYFSFSCDSGKLDA